MSQTGESDPTELVLPAFKTLKIQYSESSENCAVISFKNFAAGAPEFKDSKNYVGNSTEISDIVGDGCIKIDGAPAGEVYMVYSRQADHRGTRSFVKLKLSESSEGFDILGHRLIKLADYNTEADNDMRDDDTISSVSTRTDDVEQENFGPVAILFTIKAKYVNCEASIPFFHCEGNFSGVGYCSMMSNYGGSGNLVFEKSGKCPCCHSILVERPYTTMVSLERKNISKTVFRPFN